MSATTLYPPDIMGKLQPWNIVTLTRPVMTPVDMLMRMGQSHTVPLLDEELKAINDCF